MEMTAQKFIDQKGFLLTKRFFNESILLEMNGRLSALLKKNIQRFTDSPFSDDALLENFHKKIEDKDVLKQILDATIQEAREDEFFIQISNSPQIKRLFKEVTGGELEYLHFHLKPNLNDDSCRVIPWHQDQFYTTDHYSSYSLFSSLWMPLTDIGNEGGGLIVVEDSHVQGSVDHEQYKDTGMFTILPPEQGFQGRYLHLVCNKGDGIVLHPKTIHCSAINTSGRNRWAVVYFLYGR